ncbi:hypothetical protein [Actinomadura atramentaria]|uniref:hypothetical protein n=1 Tax=Actinomadura atramentaria TaxID=1990 RepID=UPI000524AECD|nr:hypothetical protein [Actinomadura atramentaria]
MRAYRYVGPAEIAAAVRGMPPGVPVRSADDLAAWLAGRARDELGEPFTFVVGLDGLLRLAPRRGEHVACAGGEDVLSAGEIAFERDGLCWAAVEVSNQSTGYCPEPASWRAVADALDRAGIAHPGEFTFSIVFRRCPGCGERNVVRDGFFACVFCASALPEAWNFDGGG